MPKMLFEAHIVDALQELEKIGIDFIYIKFCTNVEAKL